ncbi:BZ3500_MvSof-1268-A1-R1_Chr2-2g04857 [Microbotryum saponariae]|uniref:non-specific serine/threonine protein kinase n=1 Tax=Microbotryum saponariae TaxID=289078 RepID=A0A2X0N6D9_9BASI|nr:BZ3500_MvSof-1268-A1-R1_Chr2-2g04857 [Microbotryum saponariae]SDA00337.1 BZ3501_MvSof-1269-A2-R1_Chr2-2g04531 [Microbotryum saponariae]
MKLDATDLRYISADAFRVLSAVEQGSKNHELVPTSLIAQISGARSGGVNKALGELSKRKLVGKIQNAKSPESADRLVDGFDTWSDEGYRLTYGGYDFLACRTFAKRGTIYSVGNQIGTGKESDIYVVADDDGAQMVMKIHRLGRLSFRTIKSKRDYLRKGQSASWMYMSRLAAIKEFAFMKVLHEHGFPVPSPIDQSRHCLIMELIDAFPLRQIASLPSPGTLYSQLMDLIVRLAKSGLIHGDFNEFNILIRDHRTQAEKERDDESAQERIERIEREGGDFPVIVDVLEWEGEGETMSEMRRKGVLVEPVLIDFPQMVSIDHTDAEYYFNRDVSCIRTFFLRRFKYESALYPRFSTIMSEGAREFDLDVEVAASGFTKGDREVLQGYLDELREREGQEGLEGSESEDEDGEGSEDEEEEELEVAGLSLKDEKEGEEDGQEEGEGDVEERDEVDGEESEGESNSASESDLPNHRQHRPSARRIPRETPDVSSIVTSSLKKQKSSTERRHHGKKPVTANVLGRQKGSKMKQDSRRGIKEASFF